MNVMKNLSIKLLPLVILLGTVSMQAQKVISDTLRLCETHALPEDLGQGVNLGLSAGGGHWDEISMTDSAILVPKVSNIVVAIDRKPGEYLFRFTPKNNPCMNDADRAYVLVQIIETARPVNHHLSLCPGTSFSFDLESVMSPTLRAKHNIIYYAADGLALPSSTVTIDASGELLFSYKVEALDGCIDSTAIVLNVFEDALFDNAAVRDSLAFCVAILPDSINLNEKYGFSAAEGSWRAISTPAPKLKGNTVHLKDWNTTGRFDYEYKWKDCSNDDKTDTFTLIITDDLTSNFEDASIDVCVTNNPNGYIDLMSLVGVDLPLNSGEWFVIDQEAAPVDIEDGIFELSDAVVGTYRSRFVISNAINICGLTVTEVEVAVNVFDNAVLDGNVQLCLYDLEEGDSLYLNEYIANLPAGGIWLGIDNNEIRSDSAHIGDLSKGTHKFTYLFDGGPCGDGLAELFVSVVDGFTEFRDKTISYCLTDAGADAIDLDQILKIGNIAGSWTVDSNISAGNFDNINNVFNGSAQGTGDYIFTFTAANNGSSCIGSSLTAKVKVVITDTLIP